MIPIDYWLLINKEVEMYVTMHLKITELEIDDGILFPHMTTYKYISSASIV